MSTSADAIADELETLKTERHAADAERAALANDASPSSADAHDAIAAFLADCDADLERVEAALDEVLDTSASKERISRAGPRGSTSGHVARSSCVAPEVTFRCRLLEDLLVFDGVLSRAVLKSGRVRSFVRSFAETFDPKGEEHDH